MEVQELTLTVNGAPLDYIRFGGGEKTYVMVAGMSLCGIRGLGHLISNGYQLLSDDYTLYVFDHRRELPEGFTVRDMAEDIACALEQLGISGADMMGFSLGGMIVQCLAIDHPSLVHTAVLCSTACTPNPTAQKNFTRWIDAARTMDVSTVNQVFYQQIWTEETYRKNASVLPALLRYGDASQCPGFAVLSRACLTFDRAAELGKIRCPVLVIGVKGDKVFSGEASAQIAERLNCRLYLYEGYGHAVCDEAPDFKERILQFYRSVE